MGLGNGNKTKGNKGSNFAFEYATLKLLKGILDSGGGGDTSSLAQESTLLSVLNAILTGNQDVELLLVRDTGNNDLVVKQVTDYTQDPIVVYYKDVNGNDYTPVGPLEYLDPSAVMNLMLTELELLNAGGQLLTEATFAAEDFATETTLAGIKAKTDLLNFITTALEVTVTNSTLPDGAATEVTLASVLAELTSIDGKVATETTLGQLLLAFNAEDFATEATLDLVKDATEALNTSFDVLLSTRASEATLAAQATDIGNVLVTLNAINSKLNTLGQKVSADSAPVVLSTEQEAILEAIKVAVQSMDGDLDGIATEATLAALLLAFNSEDFATQTTLQALLTAFNAEDFATETTLSALTLAFGSTDFATQTTLADLLTAFNTTDFSTETTLASLLTAFSNEDFASETTLALTNSLLSDIDAVLDNIKLDTANLDVTLSSRLNTLGQKTSANSAPVVLSTEQEAILDNLLKQSRTLTYSNVSIAGTIPANTLRGSIMNVGDEDGLFNGSTIPAGVTIAWGAAGMRDEYSSMTYDPTAPGAGTTFLIEYTL